MAFCEINHESDVWAYANSHGQHGHAGGYQVHVADVGVTTQHDGKQYRIYGSAELAGFLETLVILGYKVPANAILRVKQEP